MSIIISEFIEATYIEHPTNIIARGLLLGSLCIADNTFSPHKVLHLMSQYEEHCMHDLNTSVTTCTWWNNPTNRPILKEYQGYLLLVLYLTSITDSFCYEKWPTNQELVINLCMTIKMFRCNILFINQTKQKPKRAEIRKLCDEICNSVLSSWCLSVKTWKLICMHVKWSGENECDVYTHACSPRISCFWCFPRPI